MKSRARLLALFLVAGCSRAPTELSVRFDEQGHCIMKGADVGRDTTGTTEIIPAPNGHGMLSISCVSVGPTTLPAVTIIVPRLDAISEGKARNYSLGSRLRDARMVVVGSETRCFWGRPQATSGYALLAFSQAGSRVSGRARARLRCFFAGAG